MNFLNLFWQKFLTLNPLMQIEIVLIAFVVLVGIIAIVRMIIIKFTDEHRFKYSVSHNSHVSYNQDDNLSEPYYGRSYSNYSSYANESADITSHSATMKCEICDGRGEVLEPQAYGGSTDAWIPCPYCDGKGYVTK